MLAVTKSQTRLKQLSMHTRKVLGCGQCWEHLDCYYYCNNLDACLPNSRASSPGAGTRPCSLSTSKLTFSRPLVDA